MVSYGSINSTTLVELVELVEQLSRISRTEQLTQIFGFLTSNSSKFAVEVAMPLKPLNQKLPFQQQETCEMGSPLTAHSQCPIRSFFLKSRIAQCFVRQCAHV